MFFKIGVLKNFAIFTRKHLCWNLFVIQLQSSSPATILKSNSSTGVFLWTLPNFKEHLFWKTSANGCFWNLMKVFFDSWNRHYHSELVTKNIFQVHLQLWNCNNIVVFRPTNKRAQVAGSSNNLVWRSKKMRASVREKKTSFEAGHVSWIKAAACEK